MTSKVCILNDTHFGARGCSEAILESQRLFFEEVFFPTVDTLGVKKILHLGDLYDNRKSIPVIAHHQARKTFIDPLMDRGMSMDIILGNHDVYHKSTNALNTLDEMLGSYSPSIRVIRDPQTVQYGSMAIGLVPWISRENHDECMRFISHDCTADWIAGHFEIMGCHMMKGVESTHGIDTRVFDRYEQVLSGHYHTASEKGNIRYLGSQMEFTWADCNDPKWFHILDTETREIQPIRNPHTLFVRVYYDDSEPLPQDLSEYRGKIVKLIVRTKTKGPDLFEDFIQRMYDVEVYDLKIIEDVESISSDHVSITEDSGIRVTDTLGLIDAYIDGIHETHLDRSRLKRMMRDLYTEGSGDHWL